MNEHDQAPEFASEFSFSQLSITDNTFIVSHVAPWFNWLVIKPMGPGHFVNGLTVTGNAFRVIGDEIDRVEKVDTSFADLDYNRFYNVTFRDNTFNNVAKPVASPVVIEHTEASPSQAWDVNAAGKLPFDAWAQVVESVIAEGPVRNASGAVHYGAPYYLAKQGPNNDRITLRWEEPVEGTVMIKLRIDDPF